MTPTTNEIAGLTLRLALGTMYVSHALWKIFTLGMPTTMQFFAAQGFPGWTAYPVVAAELVGGVLLILGVQVRAVAVLLIPVLLGALKVHLPNGFVFSYANGGWEYPALLIVISAVQALIGEGAYTLGRLAARPRLAHA